MNSIIKSNRKRGFDISKKTLFFLERTGSIIIEKMYRIGLSFLMLLEAIYCFRYAFSKRNINDTLSHLYMVGIKSLLVISVVALFTGMILALQTGLELQRYGQQNLIGSAVAVSVVREMGPFMTGLIITASVGSSIAAQLGTMTVSDEVNALEIMGINTKRYLVMPRIFSLTIMTPFITLYTNILAIMGGALVGYTQLNVEFTSYFQNALNFTDIKDLYVGLFKAIVFGLIIGTVACHQGFSAKNGASGVGRVTRRAVIISFLLILIIGYIITRLFYI